jgi:hypothetical protein
MYSHTSSIDNFLNNFKEITIELQKKKRRKVFSKYQHFTYILHIMYENIHIIQK